MKTATVVALLLAFYIVPRLCPAHWSQFRLRRRDAIRLAVRALKNSPNWSHIRLANPGFWDGSVLLDDGSQVILQLEYGITKPRSRAWFRYSNGKNEVERLTASECEQFGVEIPILF